jgi:hypothetical protein
MMTRQLEPSDKERRGLDLARESGLVWKDGTDYVFKTTLPRRVAIADAAGEDIAYFLKDAQNTRLSDFFDPLFEEIWRAVWKGNGP